MACNVHGLAVGGAIVLRRPWRRVLNCDTKDKILFKSLIYKCQPVQKLNRITGDDRRFASPPAAAKLHVACSPFYKLISDSISQEYGSLNVLKVFKEVKGNVFRVVFLSPLCSLPLVKLLFFVRKL